MGYYLETSFTTRSAMVKDNIAQRVTPGTPKIWKGCNSLNTCPNRACEKSISIVDANGVVA